MWNAGVDYQQQNGWYRPKPVSASLALNGTPGQASNSAGSISIPITTSAPALIIVTVASQSATTGISDNSGGIIGSWTHRVPAYPGDGAGFIDEYWAFASGALSGVDITVTNATAFMVGFAFGLTGANASPFDVTSVTSNPDPASITTVSANAFIYGFFNEANNNVTPGAGWTQISTSANFAMLQYKIVSSVQTGLSVAQGSNVGSAHGVLAEAIKT